MNRRVKKYRKSTNKRKMNLKSFKNRSRKQKKIRSKSTSKSRPKSKSRRHRRPRRYQRGGTTSVAADIQTTSVASNSQTTSVAIDSQSNPGNVITEPSVNETTSASARFSLPCNLLSNSNIFQDSFVEEPPVSHLGENDYLYVNNGVHVHTV